MKHLILVSLVSLFATVAHAKSNIVVELKSVDQDLQSVQVTDAGVLNITKHDGSSLQVQLSPSNANHVKYAVEVLSTAELKNEHHDIVCMMMVAPFNIQNLFVAGKNGKLKMVLSARSCAFPDSTLPKLEYDLTLAESLKAELLVLAHQFANN